MQDRLATTRFRIGLYGAAVLVGVVHFLIAVHGSVLLPSSPLWRNPPGDQAQMLTGVIALLRDRWRWPLADTALLSFGRPFSVVFTDSVPWLSVLAKLAGLGPDQVSVLGLTILLGVVLQPVAFTIFLRALGVRRWEVLGAGMALGAMLPAWYLREAGHRALGSHWVLVLALAVAAHAVRRGVSAGVIAAATLLGALALGIHPYLFVMAGAVLLAAMLADVLRPRPGAWPCAAAGITVFLAGQALASLVLGYWGGGASGAGFGLYSMNLLSPFAPQRSGLRALLTGAPGPIVDGTGGAQWEGFNYLGAGVLLVLAASGFLLVRRMVPLPARPVLRAGLPVLTALLALAALAVSDHVYLGKLLLLRVPLPAIMQHAAGMVRSSGRLFWPVNYAVLGLALAFLARSRGRGAVAALLGAAIVLQAIDTAPLRAELRGSTAPHPAKFVFAAAPWTVSPLAGASVRLLPDFACAADGDLDAIRQMALLVVRQGGRVDGVPSGRAAPGVCEKSRRGEATLPGGPDVVNVLFAQSVPAMDRFRAALSGQCVAFTAGLACGPRALASGLPRASAAAQIAGPLLRPGTRFAPASPADPHLSGAWSAAEGGGVRASGPAATLLLRLADMPAARDLCMGIQFGPDAAGAAGAPIRLTLRANGAELGEFEVGSADQELDAIVPAGDVTPDGALGLDLAIAGGRALVVRSVVLAPAGPEAACPPAA